MTDRWGDPVPAYLGSALEDLHAPSGTPWRRTSAGSYYPACCAVHCPPVLWAREVELRSRSDELPALPTRGVEAPSSCEPPPARVLQLPAANRPSEAVTEAHSLSGSLRRFLRGDKP